MEARKHSIKQQNHYFWGVDEVDIESFEVRRLHVAPAEDTRAGRAELSDISVLL